MALTLADGRKPGSGRPPDPIKKYTEQKTPIATTPVDAVVIPDYSGVAQHEPTLEKLDKRYAGAGGTGDNYWVSGSSVLYPRSPSQSLSGAGIYARETISGSAIHLTGDVEANGIYSTGGLNVYQGAYDPSMIVSALTSPNRGEIKVENNDPLYIVTSGQNVIIDSGTVSGSNVKMTGTVSGSYIEGDGSRLRNLPAGGGGSLWTSGGNFIYPLSGQNISGSGIIIEGTVSGSDFYGDGDNLDIPLNTIENPEASKTFNLGNNKTLTFSSVDTTPVPGEGIFNIEATGAFTGSLFHVHQHSGNPGATNLVEIEGVDVDVIPLNLSGTNALSLVANAEITSPTITGLSGSIQANDADIAGLSGSSLYAVTDRAGISGSATLNTTDIATNVTNIATNTTNTEDLSGSLRTLNTSLSGSYFNHAGDSTDPHGVTLTQTGFSGANMLNTGDHNTSGSAFCLGIIMDPSATPPPAGNFPQGTIYLQYTL